MVVGLLVFRSGESGQDVERGAHDAVGVDAVIAVDVVERADLPELADAEGGAAHLVDSGEECECVGAAVQDGDHRGRPVGGEELVEDPARAGAAALPGLPGFELELWCWRTGRDLSATPAGSRQWGEAGAQSGDVRTYRGRQVLR